MNNTYYFLRHGQTIYQKENRGINYEPDSPQKLEITEDGREMLKNSAKKLKTTCKEQKISIDVIMASPYLRTRQSAEIVSKILQVKEIIYDERLVDINLGEFMGGSYDESSKFYFSGDKKFDNKPKGGDSWGDVLARVSSFVDDIDKKYKNKNILIISHADPIWLLICYLRGLKTEEEFLEARKDRINFYPTVGQLILA